MFKYANRWSNLSVLFYLAVMAVSAFIAFLSCRKSVLNKADKYEVNAALLPAAFFPMLLVLGFRDGSRGADLARYLRVFFRYTMVSVDLNIDELFFRTAKAEPGFRIYEALVALVYRFFIKGGGPSNIERVGDHLYFDMLPVNEKAATIAFCFSMAAPWLYFAYRAVKEEARRNGVILPVCCVFIQLFFTGFSMIRQIIAMSIVLYAFTQLAKDRKVRYWVFVFIAALFHFTALIGVPAFFFAADLTKDRKKGFLIKALVIAALGIFYAFGPQILGKLLEGLGKYSTIAVRRRDFGAGQLARHLPVVLLLLYFRKPLIEKNEHNRLYIDLVVFDLFVAQLNYANPVFNRFDLYFSALCIFWVPSLYQVIRDKMNPKAAELLAAAGMVGWLILRLWYYVYSNPYYLMPYIAVFSKSATSGMI